MYATSSRELVMAYALAAPLNRRQATTASRIIRISSGSKRKIDFSGAKSAPKKPTWKGVSKG